VVLSLMAITWSLTATSSFLRVSSVCRAPVASQGYKLSSETFQSLWNQLEATLATYPLSRPGGRWPRPSPSVQRPPASSSGRPPPLRLARHGLLDVMDLPRGSNLGLQLCLADCGGLRVRVSCFSQQIRPSMCSFSKRLHRRRSKTIIGPHDT
jgi:hypothetical protein